MSEWMNEWMNANNVAMKHWNLCMFLLFYTIFFFYAEMLVPFIHDTKTAEKGLTDEVSETQCRQIYYL